jgi:hypothetical protein
MHFFGGGNVEIFSRSDFRTVERTIEEPARAEAATQAMERINERMVSVSQNREDLFAQLAGIDNKVDSPEDAYYNVFDELWQFRREAREEHVTDVFTMRANMTRDEWETAFGKADN